MRKIEDTSFSCIACFFIFAQLHLLICISYMQFIVDFMHAFTAQFTLNLNFWTASNTAYFCGNVDKQK